MAGSIMGNAPGFDSRLLSQSAFQAFRGHVKRPTGSIRPLRSGGAMVAPTAKYHAAAMGAFSTLVAGPPRCIITMIDTHVLKVASSGTVSSLDSITHRG